MTNRYLLSSALEIMCIKLEKVRHNTKENIGRLLANNLNFI